MKQNSPHRVTKRFRRTLTAFLVGVSGATSGQVAHAQSLQVKSKTAEAAQIPELSERVNRLNPTGKDVALSSPLRDGEFVLGEVRFILAADDRLTVESQSLLEALRPVLSAERFTALELRLAGLSFTPTTQLDPLGLKIRYDPATIGLLIEIPPEARAPRDLRIARFEDPSLGKFTVPADLSGYVNFRSFVDYTWSGPSQGFRAPSSLIDSAIRYRGVVLENEGTLDFGSSGQKTFTREGSRLIYDDRKRLVRWSAGDQRPIGRGFSGSSQIAGIGAVRIYSIVDPLRSVQPRGDRSFTLTRPSNVQTLINGQPVRRVRLDPGTYNVSDFPFIQGTNNVQFVIEDDAGGRETVEFSQFFDRTLLAPGLTEFAAYAGVYAPFNGGSRDYQFNEPAASGWFRRGINDQWTFGGNFNARKDGLALGVESVLATSLGTLGTDVAVSKVGNIGAGFAGNVSLQRTFGGAGSRARSMSASAEYRSPKFATPGIIIPINHFSWTLSGSYSQALGSRQFAALSATYLVARDGLRNETSARLTYGYAINSRLNLSVDATYDDRNVFGREYGVRATLLIRLDPRSSAVSEIDSRSKRIRAGYQTSRGEGVGSWTASGDIDVGQDDVGLNAGFNYIANRAEAGIAHTTLYGFNGRQINSQRTSARVGTALVFADGKFGISRPIYDSFAMVAAHPSLEGANVYIDPRAGHYTAKSDFLGPAIDPNLSAYVSRTLTYDVPNAPVGYDLGAASVRVAPPYRGGYLVIAGSDYSVTAVGTLLAINGQPVSLLVGTATELDVATPTKVTIFTNRRGRFGLSGLRTGRWRIDMPTEPPSTTIIEIPADKLGIVRLGDVQLGDTQ